MQTTAQIANMQTVPITSIVSFAHTAMRNYDMAREIKCFLMYGVMLRKKEEIFFYCFFRLLNDPTAHSSSVSCEFLFAYM